MPGEAREDFHLQFASDPKLTTRRAFHFFDSEPSVAVEIERMDEDDQPDYREREERGNGDKGVLDPAPCSARGSCFRSSF